MALSLSTQPEPLLNSDKALLSQSTSPSPSPASSAAIAPKIPATFDRWVGFRLHSIMSLHIILTHL